MIIAGSRCGSSRRMQLDDRCGKLRSIESLKSSWTIIAGSRCRSWLVNRSPGFDSMLG